MVKKRTFARMELRLVPTTTTGYQVVNLEEAFSGKFLKVFLWPKFQAILDCIGITNIGIVIDNGIVVFDNPEAIADSPACFNLGDDKVHLDTSGGKDETLIRLAVVMSMIYKYQRSGEEGVLKNDGTGNIIGWFKMPTGEVVRVLCYWGGNAKGWYFDAHSNYRDGLGAKRRFICIV